MRLLLEALDRFVAQARAARRERVLATARRDAARRIGEAFREQGRLLLDGMREYRWRFALREAGPATGVPAKKKRPAQEWFPEWDALFSRAAAQTARAFTIPLERLVRFALKVGAQEVDAGVGVSFSLSNPRAQSYLEAHGAELVRNIDETTRQAIHDILVEGEQQGWSYDRVAQEIIARFEEFAVGRPQEHIDSRAHLIAVTESGNAYEAGNYLPIRAMAEAGLEMEKSWLTVGDDRVSEVCQGNQDEGWIPWDQAHESGQQHPLAHPACRCTELYRRKGSEG